MAQRQVRVLTSRHERVGVWSSPVRNAVWVAARFGHS